MEQGQKSTEANQDPVTWEERRTSPRVDLDVEVNFNEHTNFYVGFSENISEGVLFVATYQLKDVGTEIDLRFTLPDDSMIEVKGTVRWIRDPHDVQDPEAPPPGMGIQFLDLTEEGKSVIRSFVELQQPLFYPD